MLRGLYRMAGAMETVSRNQEMISENLVNATTPGYRRQGMVFEVPQSSVGADGAAPAGRGRSSGRTPTYFAYMETGSLQKTDNPLDAALSGNAFFTVQGPNGPVYTRNGSFQLNANGQLETRGGGYRVQGQGGALTIPTNASSINIAGDGTVSADGALVGQLQLASFDDPTALRRVGPTLFEGPTPQTPAAGAVRVEQGFRESSNVQPVQEMVSMMMGLRFYEAAQKAMQTMSDTIAQNTRPQSS
jgi:flagellar basal-body rod protein FlgF